MQATPGLVVRSLTSEVSRRGGHRRPAGVTGPHMVTRLPCGARHVRSRPRCPSRRGDRQGGRSSAGRARYALAIHVRIRGPTLEAYPVEVEVAGSNPAALPVIASSLDRVDVVRLSHTSRSSSRTGSRATPCIRSSLFRRGSKSLGYPECAFPVATPYPRRFLHTCLDTRDSPLAGFGSREG